jgi:hypothetical protein
MTVIKKYTEVGTGIIFHQIIESTIADASATNKNPRAGFCKRIKRRKNTGNSHVAKGMIHLPFENSMSAAPANNKMIDFCFISAVFYVTAQSSGNETNRHFTFGKK